MKRLGVLSVIIIALGLLQVSTSYSWEIDLSRRQKRPMPTNPPPTLTESAGPSEPAQVDHAGHADQGIVHVESKQPLSAEETTATEVIDDPSSKSLEKKPISAKLEGIVKRTVTPVANDRQEFVILNTEKGFIPSNVRVRKGLHYRVHIVNVNEERKNVSFMLDAFKQHHATYFGKIKTFNLDPDKEGIFEFQCPETAAEGKLVVFGSGSTGNNLQRHVSSAE